MFVQFLHHHLLLLLHWTGVSFSSTLHFRSLKTMDDAFFDDTVVSNHTSSSFLIETTSSSSPKISKSSITVTGMKSSFSEPINIAHPPPLLLMIMMSSPSFSSSFSLLSNFTASKRAPYLNSVASRFTSNSDRLRSIGLFNGGCNGKKVVKRTPLMASLVGGETQSKESRFDLYQEVSKAAREKFNQVISVRSKDRDLSLAKALLYIAAEDEAFMAINRDMDAHSLQNERRDSSISYKAQDWDCLEAMPLAGKCMSEWIIELDVIAKEVEAELVSRDIGCDLMEVMEAVNFVLFKTRGFKRFPVLLDSKFSYLHTVLNSGCGSAILLSIIYIEVCRRIGLNIVGSRVGEDFLIWPQTGNPEELFKVSSSGHSLLSIVNGSCVNDPRSKASDLNSKSLLGLDMASDRDIIGIALANLIRLHWKRASRANHGLMLTSPIRPVHESNEKSGNVDSSKLPLLRPLELRLAIMASERLLILQSHNWALRRDHGMLLYFSRKYPEAVQELSICMAFAPEEEAKALEPFVEKLHLLQIESSWKSLGHGSQLAVP